MILYSVSSEQEDRCVGNTPGTWDRKGRSPSVGVTCLVAEPPFIVLLGYNRHTANTVYLMCAATVLSCRLHNLKIPYALSTPQNAKFFLFGGPETSGDRHRLHVF